MFENAGAARPGRPPAAMEPAPRLAGGQHLRNLGKAVGARVTDLLRRKEPAPAVTEVNAAALGPGQPPGEDGPEAVELLPRLDPPPAAAKKRAPRALTTPQDMLIAPEATPEVTAPLSPGAAVEAPMAVERGGGVAPGTLPVPDLIHKGLREHTGAEQAAGGSPRTHKPAERPPPAGSAARAPEGLHPDLLAFE